MTAARTFDQGGTVRPARQENKSADDEQYFHLNISEEAKGRGARCLPPLLFQDSACGNGNSIMRVCPAQGILTRTP